MRSSLVKTLVPPSSGTLRSCCSTCWGSFCSEEDMRIFTVCRRTKVVARSYSRTNVPASWCHLVRRFILPRQCASRASVPVGISHRSASGSRVATRQELHGCDGQAHPPFGLRLHSALPARLHLAHPPSGSGTGGGLGVLQAPQHVWLSVRSVARETSKPLNTANSGIAGYFSVALYARS